MMLDAGTFGGTNIDHIVVDILNKRNDVRFSNKVLAVITHYNKDVKEVSLCNLPRNLKLILLQKLLEDRKKWLDKYMDDDPMKSYLANCFVSKKRQTENIINKEMVNEKQMDESEEASQDDTRTAG